MENIDTALLITLIGMSLVFGAIILIWGVLGSLVRLTTPREKTSRRREGEPSVAEQLLKKRAAAAAVAYVITQQTNMDEPREFPLPPTALVSPWQAVMRTNILNKRGRIR